MFEQNFFSVLTGALQKQWRELSVGFNMNRCKGNEWAYMGFFLYAFRILP